MKKKVLFIDSVHPELNKILEENNFECIDGTGFTYSEILTSIEDFYGLVIRSRFIIDEKMISAARNLKFIARAGAGMENINTQFAEGRGIHCLHAPEGNRDAVGEHALGMLLCLFNKILTSDQEVRSSKWIREGNRGIELQGKTIGIIGFGNMGSAFAKRLQGFDVTILAYDKYKKDFGNNNVIETSLKEIQEKSDVLSLHVPLTSETSYMVNMKFIEGFKKEFYIINTARGKVVETEALANAIKSGKILGACLDVLEYETTSFEQVEKEKIPAPLQFLFNAPNVIFTPHIAGWSYQSHKKISEVLGRKILEI